ncbi:mediator of RNA polymerase II transcription subunit 6, partial [Lecanoromycetidae sp. Uapishka_2]
MASAPAPPLDEVQFNAPEYAKNLGGIATNTVLPYFYASPFYDHTSNNAALTVQALNNPNLYYLIQTREAFEARLRTMIGLEFMVTHDPSENDTKHPNSGVWVIRKQIRRKRPGQQDEVTGVSSYYVVGENVYMASSAGDIVGSRMLSTVASMTKLLSLASTLPNFTPALGHTYLAPNPKNPTPGSSLQVTQTSKESTPVPGSSTPSGTQDTAATRKDSAMSKTADYSDAQMLSDSYRLLMSYVDEYMDENPIIGEPGSFKLAKSRPLQLPPSVTSSMSTSKPDSQQSLKVATPTPANGAVTPQLKTEDLPAPVKKPIKGAEKSPTTPVGKEKKRKKSKVPGAEDPIASKVTTPK